MNNKKLILALIALVLVLAAMLSVYILTRPVAVAGEKTVTVVVVHKDGSEKTFTCHTDAGNLQTVLLEEEIAQGEDGPYGLMIHTVDGETASWENDNAWWSIYIGEELAVTGALEITLNDGAVYKLVYTRG